MAHLVRVLQKKVAKYFPNATPVSVSGDVAAPEFQLRVEAPVSKLELVDGEFFPPVGVCESSCQADGRLQSSIVESGRRWSIPPATSGGRGRGRWYEPRYTSASTGCPRWPDGVHVFTVHLQLRLPLW